MTESFYERLLGEAMRGGADFCEIFQEYTKKQTLRYLDGKIDQVTDNRLSGVGIRAFLGTRTVFASTSDLSEAGLLRCARAVASGCGDLRTGTIETMQLSLMQPKDIHPVIRDAFGAAMREKADLLKEACQAAASFDERILQVSGMLALVDREITVTNTEGLFKKDRHRRVRMAVSAVAGANGENQSGFCGPGGGCGLELFETRIPAEIGKHAARQAVTNLQADYIQGGPMTVAIENGFGGVIFHEACGHSLEATSVGIGASQMCGKLGQKIANEKITAVDDGTIPNAWGSVNIDDEGTPTQRNVLIENGILRSYLVDRLGSRRMQMPMTGSGRRENYEYEATSRMTNTFIENGPDKNEDIIASIEYGLYAREMGGGSVNPLTGAFNFAVTEGYIIRNGKICEPVRGASLIGTGSQILKDIDMVGRNLERGQGMCGSSSGSIPTDVGQPLIRVSKITVGGR